MRRGRVSGGVARASQTDAIPISVGGTCTYAGGDTVRQLTRDARCKNQEA